LRKENLSIIIVDDLQFSREVVKSALTKSGFTDIRTASSADEGMFLLNEFIASLVCVALNTTNKPRTRRTR